MASTKKTPKKTIKVEDKKEKERKNWVDGNVETQPSLLFVGKWSKNL
jgi:hypothetical protein